MRCSSQSLFTYHSLYRARFLLPSPKRRIPPRTWPKTDKPSIFGQFSGLKRLAAAEWKRPG